MNKLISILSAFLLSACATTNLVKHTPSLPGPKRYVIWNKKDFTKKPGQLKSMSVSTLSAMGAKNIKQMEVINGFSFESEKEIEKIAGSLSVFGANGEWQIQEEQEHHILADACYRHVPVLCPGGPIDPIPKCPSPPGVGPCGPIDPGPIEGDKSWSRARVKAKAAMEIVDSSQIRAGTIDTGLDMNHPNKGNVIATVSMTGEPVSPDVAMHGTHVSGTVFGRGGINISMAKGYFCKGLGNNGSGQSSWLANCLVWMKQQGVQVVSNSWGGGGPDQLINQAVTALAASGAQVFFANGNDSGAVNWPAKLSGTVPNVWAIAASDERDQIASFSSRGPETKFIAPGVNVISNKPGGGTQAMSGTSMATPTAAGVCVLGLAAGKTPCIKSSGMVGGYPMVDAMESIK